jgi:hypothetical protein
MQVVCWKEDDCLIKRVSRWILRAALYGSCNRSLRMLTLTGKNVSRSDCTDTGKNLVAGRTSRPCSGVGGQATSIVSWGAVVQLCGATSRAFSVRLANDKAIRRLPEIGVVR